MEENGWLNAEDREHKQKCQADLKSILKEEEIKWLQRSHEKELFDGDTNSKYYHAKANGRHRKNKINKLVQDEGVIEGQDNLKEYITGFYKNLFGEPEITSLILGHEGVDVLSEAEQNFLTRKLSLEELKDAVFGMEKNKAAGPDGFNIEFYQHFWDLVKMDLLALLDEFYVNNLDIDRLNYGVISLLPKGSDPDRIQKYRPICLLNVIFKIFTKILVNMLIVIIKGVIRASQIAFLKGRYILEGVLILHESLNSLHKKKTSGVLFKIDFEKAFDKVKWPFLMQTLKMKKIP